MKNFLGFAVVSYFVAGAFGPAAFAAQGPVKTLTCLSDQRPLDADLVQVVLKLTSDHYDLSLRTATGGRRPVGNPNVDQTRMIAHDLVCKFSKNNDHVVSCARERKDGESVNTYFYTTLETLEGVDIYTGAETRKTSIVTDMYSAEWGSGGGPAESTFCRVGVLRDLLRELTQPRPCDTGAS